MDEENKFIELLQLNVNDKTEKKKTGNTQLTYLSWSFAWSEFVKVYPQATYEIVKNENGLPYFHDDSGAMVYTKVKAGGITHEMWLPVMDGANKAMKSKSYDYTVKGWNGGADTIKTVLAYSMFDINKTVMRCLVKNLAMFGLGLYIYAGEDLPEGEEQPQPKAQLQQTPQRKINQLEGENLMELIEKTDSDLEKFCGAYKVSKVSDLTVSQYQDAVKKLQVKAAKNA